MFLGPTRRREVIKVRSLIHGVNRDFRRGRRARSPQGKAPTPPPPGNGQTPTLAINLQCQRLKVPSFVPQRRFCLFVCFLVCAQNCNKVRFALFVKKGLAGCSFERLLLTDVGSDKFMCALLMDLIMFGVLPSNLQHFARIFSNIIIF